ncbi:MAG: DMT family transporter [Clostridia bacterium]|nr:DMT family transporter [Clostridia bacterium]
MNSFFKKYLGSFALLLAAVIWGFAFVAQTSGAKSIPAFTLNALRSFVGFAFLALLIAIMSIKKKDLIPSDKASVKSLIIGGICCGVALFIATGFQQYAIGTYPPEAAASGRSGFITALYVVLVPCVSALILKKKIHPIVWLGIGIAVVGMYLLSFSKGISGIYLGDLITFLCAVSFCGHILVIDHFVAKNNGILLSCIQFFTVGVLSLVVALIFEKTTLSAILEALIPVLYLGIMSSGVAYTLQVVGQKYTAPTTASILMSLESVFAVIGGALVLGERLSFRELIGCLLMFAAIIVAQSPDFAKAKKE